MKLYNYSNEWNDFTFKNNKFNDNQKWYSFGKNFLYHCKYYNGKNQGIEIEYSYLNV